MNLKQILTIIIFLLMSFGISVAQTNYNCFLQDPKIYNTDTNKLFFQFDDINFIKNNEYFGDIIKGYTLLGLNITPKITYFPNSKIKLSAGVNLLSYYSREDKSEVSILLSFQYKLLPKLDFILGNIYGTLNHKLIDPLFDFERYLNKNTEKGIQFLWSSDRVFADLWLDWEQQIFYGDPFQEKFNVGLSTNIILLKNTNNQISIPFQNLVRHEGGQINGNRSARLTTIYNNALGLSYLKSFNPLHNNTLTLSSYWVNYQDFSPTKQQMFIDGMGSYSTLEFYTNKVDLLVGYWYGEQFIAPIGNPLFETYSRTNIFVEEPVRQIIIGKISYHRDVYEGINMGFRFDSFYDLEHGNFEYAWTFLVIFNSNFLLRSF